MTLHAPSSADARPTLRLTARSAFVPKYLEVADALLSQMAEAGLQPGDRLATEVELVERYGVSRPTVRQALAVLESEGYLSRKKGTGTFVRKAPSSPLTLAASRGTVVIICSAEQASHAEEDFAFLHYLRTTEQALGRHGLAVQIVGVGLDEDTDRQRILELKQQVGLRGILAVGSNAGKYLDLCPAVPIVTTGTFYPDKWPWVGTDVAGNCREAIDHLLAHGHRDIALICGPWLDQKAFERFARGYREAFAGRGLTPRRSLMYHAQLSERVATLARDVLADPVRPTAVFAENWQICDAVLSAAEDLGLRIPDDVSLVAYGENSLRVKSSVPITVYEPDGETDAIRLVDMLRALTDGRPVSEVHVANPGMLIEGESVRHLGASPEQRERA